MNPAGLARTVGGEAAKGASARRARPPPGEKLMQLFDLDTIAAESAENNQAWREFLRVPSLSMGLYRLKAGQADEQQPHTEDEVYAVLGGKAVFRAGGREQAVGSGSV